MPDPASADFVGTGRFAFNNAAANRRELVNGGDLLKDRSVPPQKLSRDAFPPDIRPGPSGEKPSWHDEPDKDAHEKGTPPSLGDPQRYDRVARADHNHDFTYQRVGMTQVSGTAPAEYVAPFYDAGEGPHPAATPDEPHKRIANWSVHPDYADRIKGGAIEVWTETSVDSGVTWREPVLRAVVPPGSISAEYEVRDVDWDPATYVVEPQVRVYVKPVGHDQDPALKVVRAGVDGKIDPDWLPAATTRKPLVYADGTKPAGNTVADTTSKTAFLSSYTIPANRLAVGSLIRIRARGFHATTGTPTLLFEVEIGGIVALTLPFTCGSSVTDKGWSFEADAVVTAIGASGNLEVNGEGSLATSTTTALHGHGLNVGGIAKDTTATISIIPYATWGSASPSNTVTLHTLTVEILDLDT